MFLNIQITHLRENIFNDVTFSLNLSASLQVRFMPIIFNYYCARFFLRKILHIIAQNFQALLICKCQLGSRNMHSPFMSVFLLVLTMRIKVSPNNN